MLSIGKIEEALEQSHKATELDSANAVSFEVTDKIIGMDETNYEAYVNRCFALLGMGKYKEAVEAGNIAIELDSDKSLAYLNRSIAFFNTEDYEKAIEDGETAIQLAKNENDEDIISKGYISIGNAYVGKHQYDKAIEMYQKAAEYNVNDRLLSEINSNMGKAFLEKNNFDEAIRFADIAIELNGKDDKPYVVKAEALLEAGKKEEAMETILKAIEIKPDSFLAYNLVVLPLVLIIFAIVIITKIKKTGMQV